jgi:hypothetical protein
VALLPIDPDRLLDLFMRGLHAYEMVDGLPEDAEVYGIGYPVVGVGDEYHHKVFIVVRSETFPEVKEGEAIPRLSLIYKPIDKGRGSRNS